MDKALTILSDLTIYAKYAKYLPSAQRREQWEELVLRNFEMHMNKFKDLDSEFQSDLARAYNYVLEKKVLPSMRSLQFGGKPIELSPNRLFNCYKKDTKFITQKGVKSFEDFNDGDEIVVPSHTGQMRDAIVRSYGKQKLNRVILRRGKVKKSINVTSDHRWLLRDGKETTSLKEGDVILGSPKIYSNFVWEDADPLEKLYWCYGYVYGDGTRNGKHSMVRLCGDDKNKFLHRFQELGFNTSEPLSCGGDAFAYTGSYQKIAPDPEVDSPEMIKAFVVGYLDADGSKNPDWYGNNDLSPYIGIQSSEKDHIEFIEKCFESVGFYITSEKDLTGQVTNYGTRPFTKKYRLSTKVGTTNIGNHWVVDSIFETNEEDTVWCLEVEEDHSFILSGGIVTGNCAFTICDNPAVFSETMFLLLGGSGVGFSVQKHHVEKLPELVGPKNRTRRYLVSDSIEGWGDAVKVLVEAYFYNKSDPIFDYRDIRSKGMPLITSGGKAPGPQPLKDCIHNLRKVLDLALDTRGSGTLLKPIEVHDMMCYIADAVLSGGIRRAALISLFSFDDNEMLESKFGNWYELNPQRARANNSAVALRNKIKKKDFIDFFLKVQASNSGEPGIYFTNDKDYGCNPCCEIGLKPNQFCNLTTINVSDITTQEELNNRAWAAAFIGTLQASYTDFHYLRDVWKKTTEKEALIGVSMTGIASGGILSLDLEESAQTVIDTNKKVANLIGINPAARTTCVKPEGTASLVVGSSSGVHAWHAPYYIRRLRFNKAEPLYSYLKKAIPSLVEDEVLKPDLEGVVSIPIKAPDGAITRGETALELLERGKFISDHWVKPGHISGQNTHNVSITVSVRDEEWEEVGEWMWENRQCYNGIALLPHHGGTYTQAPFEDCSEETYNEMLDKVRLIDLTKVKETEDYTNLKDQAACAGGACELT